MLEKFNWYTQLNFSKNSGKVQKIIIILIISLTTERINLTFSAAEYDKKKPILIPIEKGEGNNSCFILGKNRCALN